VNEDYARLAVGQLAADEVVRVQNWELVARSTAAIRW
jgi:hypothetical protein